MSLPGAPTGLTVLIPAYDEEESIGPTVDAVRAAFAGAEHELEIMVIDDGSRDDTAARAEAAGAVVVRHPHRSGYGRALKTGIVTARHDTIAISDADGSYPVEELPVMYELAQRHDLVIGARTGPLYRGTLLRSPARAAFVLLASFVAGQWIPDPNSGLRIFHRGDVVPLFPDLPRGFSFTTTQTLIMTLAGAFIHYRPVEYRARIGKSKILFVRHSLQIAQGLTEVVLRHNPLKLFLLVGLTPLAAMLAVLCGDAGESRLLAGAILGCTGILVFALGMLAAVVLRRPPSMPR